MRRLLSLLVFVLPSSLRRHVGRLALGWDIHPTAHIGPSLILVRHLSMGPGTHIGRLNVIRGIDELRLDEGARINERNRVSGFLPSAQYFGHSAQRRPSLLLGKHARITIGHQIDCSDRVELHDYAVLAGFHTTVLTHSVDLVRNRDITQPVEIGTHSVVMTDCILLSGARVPARCIVSAGSVVNTKLTEENTFYGGNPVKPMRELSPDLAVFKRGDPED